MMARGKMTEERQNLLGRAAAGVFLVLLALDDIFEPEMPLGLLQWLGRDADDMFFDFVILLGSSDDANVS
jgi:hypothetical protein